MHVDGFNLYFGMVDGGLNHCKWLNVKSLIESCLSHNQSVVAIKYFTSRVTNNPSKQKRQTTYIGALETTGIQIVYGLYRAKTIERINCGHAWFIHNEKMTDVNIATHLLTDAFTENFDTAILISGDSDLVSPIKAVHQQFPGKSVSVFFPPERHNNTVAIAAKGSMILGRKKLVSHQFPDTVEKVDGFVLKKPTKW